MPLDITFTLSDQDLEHFQAIVDKAKAAMGNTVSDQHIEAAARKLIEEAGSASLPDFIASRLVRLQKVIDMINDGEWNLAEEDRKRVIGALMYLCDPEDLIPDAIPGLGFLDDAIYVELVLRALKVEIDFYDEFCEFRDAEEARRREQGIDLKVNREAWLADKRASLHKKMHKPRRGSSGGWRVRW